MLRQWFPQLYPRLNKRSLLPTIFFIRELVVPEGIKSGDFGECLPNLKPQLHQFCATFAHIATSRILKPLIHCSNRSSSLFKMLTKIFLSLLRRVAIHEYLIKTQNLLAIIFLGNHSIYTIQSN